MLAEQTNPPAGDGAPLCVLVTGGCGFIGGNFVRLALRQGMAGRPVRVVNLDLLTYAGCSASLADVAGDPRYTFCKGDIGDSDLVERLLREHRPVAVVNFAAESHVDRSIDGPDAFIQTNVVGTHNLLRTVRQHWEGLPVAERGAFRLLHVSTDEVYGSLGPEGKFTEETPYHPNSPYSASKASSDHLVRAYHHTYGLPTLITNCSNNYGPFQFPEKLIPLVTLNALAGRPLPIYGDGKNVRDWLYVEDHCEALLAVLERGRVGETYNIGGDSERTNLEVVHAICDAVDRLAPQAPMKPARQLIQFVKDRPGHDRRYAVDAGKIARELGWRPRHGFATGIADTVAWYLGHADWVQTATRGGSVGDRLGLGEGAPQQAAPLVPRTRPAERYVEGEIEGVLKRPLGQHRDARGWLTEVFRSDELPADLLPAMAYVSQTQPGVARGPHEHVDQADYFAFIGPGEFDLYLWDSRPDSPTYGASQKVRCGESNPCGVVIPAGVVHAYKCCSSVPGWVFNAPNRLYAGHGKKDPVDEIRHENDPSSPYQLS